MSNESIPATPLQPAIPTRPQPCPPPPGHCPPPPVPPMPGPCPPNGRRRPLFCGPVDTTPPGWPYEMYACPPIPPEGYKIPPLERYCPGLNTEAQLDYLYTNVNHLIEVFNQANEKMFGAYQAVVASATCNNAYYNCITTEEGFFSGTDIAYKVIHIPFVDEASQPIYFELGLPYNSVENIGNKENCYSASKNKLADKLVPIGKPGMKWRGWTIYKGQQINTPNPPVIQDTDKDYYIFGVTENGFMKWYPSSVGIRTLNVDKVRNAMNVDSVLINTKQISPQTFSEHANETLGRVGVGMNYDTKMRYIIVVDGSEQTGCTEQQLAELFSRYGCDMAVQLAYSVDSWAMDKGLFAFEPSTVNVDQTPTMPEVGAYWYITKRRHYHNEFVREIAYLTQLMGEQIWYDWINADSIDYVKDRVAHVYRELLAEIENRTKADEMLQENINQEVNAREEDVRNLQANINAEATTRANNDIVQVVKTEATNQMTTWQLLKGDGNYISVPIVTYNYELLVNQLDELSTIQERLNAEIAARKEADDAIGARIDTLNAALQQEVSDRVAAINSVINQMNNQIDTVKSLISAEESARLSGDTQLQTALNTLRTEYETFVTSTGTNFTNVNQAIDNLRSELESDITELNTKVNTAQADIATLNTQYSDLTARMATLNAAVTAMQNTVLTIEQSFDNMKTSFNALDQKVEEMKTAQDSVNADFQKQIDDLKSAVDSLSEQLTNVDEVIKGLDDRFVLKAGDTMTGDLTLPREKIPTSSSTEFIVIEKAYKPFSTHPNESSAYTDFLNIKRSSNNSSFPIIGGSSIPKRNDEIPNRSAIDSYFSSFHSTIEGNRPELPNYSPFTFSDLNSIGLSYGHTGHTVKLVNKGGTSTYRLNFEPSTYLGGIVDPTYPSDAATKGYVDTSVSELGSNYLPLTGGTVTGKVNFASSTQGTYGIQVLNDSLFLDKPKSIAFYIFNSGLTSGITNVKRDVQVGEETVSQTFVIIGSTNGSTIEEDNFGLIGGRPNPLLPQELVQKQYVDNAVASVSTDAVKENIENGPWLSSINLGAGTNPVNIRTDINGIFFTKPGTDGGGSLAEVKVGTPTTDASAIPKSYIADLAAEIEADNHNYTDSKLTRYLPLAGGTMTGDIVMDGSGEIPARVQYDIGGNQTVTLECFAETNSEGEATGAVALFDTSIGSGTSGYNPVILRNVNNPEMQYDAVNKGYADANYLSTNGGNVNGELTLTTQGTSSHSIIFQDNNSGYASIDYNYSSDETSNNHLLVYKRVGTESSDIVVRGVADPVSDNDAVNKKYVKDVGSLLWNNDNPSSEFAGITINVPDMVKYQAVIINFLYEQGNNFYVSSMLVKNARSRVHEISYGEGDTLYTLTREMTWNSGSNSISFSICTLHNVNDKTHSTANSNLIPMSVYGLEYAI